MAVRETLWLTLDDLLVVVREFLNPKVSRSGLMRSQTRATIGAAAGFVLVMLAGSFEPT